MEKAMSNYNCDYVRRHYGVPAEIGRRVIANGEPGVIMADRGQYIGVILDGDPKKRIRNYHPTLGDAVSRDGREASAQAVGGAHQQHVQLG
ncbi:hypothetical protein PP4_18080 [Pseudomonas putida NBRC 14164]|uniref:Uncharacterized protein n=1 Tax=Pseudomonas putida NBRC 14164 TaxID=1211579 RepID=A0ABM7ECV2_PSEPU|nr:hypothetical protein PP4_18080 [Pseudomonas putida NBRC 14164]